MQNQPLIIAGGAFVVGVLLSVAISGSRVDSKLESAIDRVQSESGQSLEEANAALASRIEALESGLSQNADAAASAIDEKLASLEQDIAGRIEAISQASSSSVEELQASLSALAASLETVAAGSSAPSVAVTMDMPTEGPLGVGQTAIFDDGKVRAFVGALDRDAGTARLNLNGENKTLSIGQTVSLSVDGSDCSVALAGVGSDGATIGSDCGLESAKAALPPVPEDGFAVGQTAILADGALRIFVSGLAADRSSARLAINGTDMQTVAAGSSVAVEAGDASCDVMVVGVGEGVVALEAACGG